MDNLEKHIKEQRALLDSIEQPEMDIIWNGIQGQLEQRPKSGWNITLGRYWQMTIAASICLLVAGTLFIQLNFKKQEQLPNLASFYPELAEEEAKYQQLISDKETEINLTKIDQLEYQHIFTELKLLETFHKESLIDFTSDVPNEQIVQVLIRYYEQKIRILERLSKEIEKRKEYETTEHNNERPL